VRHLAQPLELLRLQALPGHLELKVGNHRAEVQVAASLAKPVDRSLDLRRSHLDGGQRVGDGQLSVVVAVDPQSRPDNFLDAPDRLADMARQPASVRIAENDPVRPTLLGGLEALQGELRIGPKAVKKVLRIEDDLRNPLFHVRDRIRDHFQIGLLADPQVILNVKVPRLSNQGHDRGIRLQKNLQAEILVRARPRPSGSPEGGDFGRLQLDPPHLIEKVRVSLVGAGIPAFDIVHPQVVELLHDPELVLERKRHVLGLAAVPERGVVDQNVLHGRPFLSIKTSCKTRTANSAYFSSMTTDILISEVEIISMLMPSPAST
jgi:hypothetical protein